MLFCRLLIFFKINLFEIILSGIPLECQTVWIQIRPDVLTGLIWVQSVCKGYKQTTLGGRVIAVNHIIGYDQCSKISNINCLTKRPRKPVLTLIRLLPKKLSVQGLPHLLVCESKPWQLTFFLRTERKAFEIFDYLLYIQYPPPPPTHTHTWKATETISWFCLLKVQVNNFSVMLGHFFLGLTSTKQCE